MDPRGGRLGTSILFCFYPQLTSGRVVPINGFVVPGPSWQATMIHSMSLVNQTEGLPLNYIQG
jgi:hypothetical protein